MTKEEFEKAIEQEAVEYMKETLADWEEHEDAAEAILTDYTEGAFKAYELLNS